MKNRLIILLITLTVSLSCRADICPLADQIDPQRAPPEWRILGRLDPDVELTPLFFRRALRIMEFTVPTDEADWPQPMFENGHVLCEYQTCAAGDCPSFVLISDFETQLDANNSNWDSISMLSLSKMCEPANHNPQACAFSNNEPTS